MTDFKLSFIVKSDGKSTKTKFDKYEMRDFNSKSMQQKCHLYLSTLIIRL